jgi:hypothetical protein
MQISETLSQELHKQFTVTFRSASWKAGSMRAWKR